MPIAALLRSVVFALAVTAWLSTLAAAQLPISPPEDFSEGSPEVDLILSGGSVSALSGAHTEVSPAVVIGNPGSGGLAYTQIHTGDETYNNMMGGVRMTGGSTSYPYLMTMMGQTVRFSVSGSTATLQRPNGASLAVTANTYVYTGRDGTEVTFRKLVTGDMVVHGYDGAYIETIVAPTGHRLTYHYGEATTPSGTARRLQSVTNNQGYQIHLEYARATATTDTQLIDWLIPERVSGINNAYEYCDPTANSCTLTQDWPYIDIAEPTSSERTYTDALGRVTRWTFDSSGRVTGVRIPGDTTDTIAITYYASGPNIDRVETITRGDLTWAHNPINHGGKTLAWVDHPDGRTSGTIVVNATGLVESEVHSQGSNHRVDYLYDSEDRIERITQSEGNYVEFSYDARGNVTETRQVAKPGSGLADLVTTAIYPSICTNIKTCNQPTSITDPTGATTSFTYYTHGGLNQVTQPAVNGESGVTRHFYTSLAARYLDSSGALVASGYPAYYLRHVLRCQSGTYSSSGGQNCSGDHSKVHWQTFTHGSLSQPNNLQVQAIENALRDSSAAYIERRRATLAYTPHGDVSWVDGPVTGVVDRSYQFYDAMRRPTAQIGPDPDGSGPLLRPASRTIYDSHGRVEAQETGTVTSISETLSSFVRLQRSEVDYDSIGRPTQARAFGLGTTIQALVQYTYNSGGRLECQVQRMNPAVFGSAPSSACVAGVEGSDGPDRINRTTYNAEGRVHTVSTGWDTLNPITQVTYTYTDNGKLATLTDGEGNVTQYTYDGFDRIKEIDYADPATPGAVTGSDDEIYTYDSVGRLQSRRVRSNELFQYTYDVLGRVTNVNAPSGTADTSYTYDLHNNLLTITSDGRTITNTFNALGDLLSQAGPNGTISYAYDDMGRRERLTWADGFYVTYDWNDVSQLTHIRENGATSGTGVLAEFAYDVQGRRKTLTRGNGTTTNYNFDDYGRLTSLVQDLTGTGTDVTMTLDHNYSGQIIDRNLSNLDYSYVHAITADTLFDHNGLNQITSVSGGIAAPTYDARGNLTAYNGQTFGYDTYNRLTSVGGTGGSMTLDYDPVGRLWETSGASGTARYQYDGAALIAQYSTTGAMQHRWVHGPGTDEPLVRYDGSGTTNKRWLHADERRSIIAHTDASGARIQTNTYDAYGIPGASNDGLFQYTGQIWLEDAGIYHYKARAYHAELGVFMQTDPIGHSGGINLYAYVGGDPIGFTDPSGLTRVCASKPGSRIKKCFDSPVELTGRELRQWETAWAHELRNFLGKVDPSGIKDRLASWGSNNDNVSCPTGGRRSEGRYREHEGRSFGTVPPGGAEEFSIWFSSTALGQNSHAVSRDTDREIGLAFVTVGNEVRLASMAWGPRGSRSLRGAEDNASVSVTFEGGTPFLFWHTHGRYGRGSLAGLSDDDLAITSDAAVAALEGNGDIYFSDLGGASGSRIGSVTTPATGASGC